MGFTRVSTALTAITLLFTTATLRGQQNGYAGQLTADSLPQRWSYAPERTADVVRDQRWWQTFGDNLLDSLIATAIDRNYDIGIATRRVEIARQNIGRTRSEYYPTVGISGSWTRSQQAGRINGAGDRSMTTSYWSVGANVSWEADLFGRVRNAVRRDAALADVSRADREAIMLSVISEVATEYITLRSLQAQLAIARAESADQMDVLEIVKARHDAGLSSELDVAQSETVVYATLATIPSLQSRIQGCINSLKVLLADTDGSFTTLLEREAPLPEFTLAPESGIPADLLRRRPDIIEAEATLASDAAAIGVAKADFLPTLTINGEISTDSRRLDGLFGSHSLSYSITPTLSWTVFDGMARRYALASARQQMEADVENYNLTVMNAIAEVNNALSAYSSSFESIALNRQVLEASREQRKLSYNLYRNGLSTYSDVATAQVSQLQYSNAVVESQAAVLTALVELYKALGGGFE